MVVATQYTARRGGKLTATAQAVCSVAKVGDDVTISSDGDNKWRVLSVHYPTIALERNGKTLTVEAHRVRCLWSNGDAA